MRPHFLRPHPALMKPRVEHGHDWRGGLLWVLCACLALGWIDSADNADWHRQQAMQAREDLAREVASRPLPENLRRVTFVIQARTREDLANHLADVADAADLERHYLKGKR